MAASDREVPQSPEQRRTPTLDDFLVEPTRNLEDWRWLWKGDYEFPIRSHRGLLGSILVAIKRLFRPLVKVPQNDLWERQRIFNVILLDYLKKREELHQDERDQLAGRRYDQRIEYLEELHDLGIREIMRHNDAVFARLDQKVDRYRRESRDLLGSLGAAVSVATTAKAGSPDAPPAEPSFDTVARAHEEHGYFVLERRYRGTEEEIRERISRYLPYLRKVRDLGPVLDLGCGRGEALALLRDEGIAARGVDSSARMVGVCRERGLEAQEGDLFATLAAVPEGSLGGVMSFHVIEHLPGAELGRLVHLAWRALRPGGVLILETPNPLSLVVAARNFWLDPTHQRPVHPESLKLLYDLAGFDSIERLDLRPFSDAERLPEIDLAHLPEEQRLLADRVNRLRDRIDELLFGFQDYGMVGTKAG